LSRKKLPVFALIKNKPSVEIPIWIYSSASLSELTMVCGHHAQITVRVSPSSHQISTMAPCSRFCNEEDPIDTGGYDSRRLQLLMASSLLPLAEHEPLFS
jgi:hypothetical protein